MDTFDTGLSFRRLHGPFRARLNVGRDQIEIVPAGVFGLFRGRGRFKAERAERADVVAVNRDTRWRQGLRVTTRSGVLDRFVVVPNTARQRDELHRALQSHGYSLDP